MFANFRFIEVSSDSEDDDPSNVVKGKHDLVVKSSSQKQQSGFFKSSKKRYPMFPYFEEKNKYDDYGEVIRWDQSLLPLGNMERYEEAISCNEEKSYL